MRSTRLIAGMVLGGLLVSLAGPVQAGQDPLKVGPNFYTKAFENEKVRVSNITLKPGDSIPMHIHPDHFLYVLTPGKLTLSYPDGKTADFDGKTGNVVWINAESHAAVNTGTTEFSAIVVELKPLPTYE